MKKILLVGNPNVGKSVLFSKITGINVACSNYPGTTVEYCSGPSIMGAEEVEVIDVILWMRRPAPASSPAD